MPSADVQHFLNQDYEKLKSDLLKDGQLFEDPEFPDENDFLVEIKFKVPQGQEIPKVQWLRPGEICKNQDPEKDPKFIVDNKFDRFDVKQGELGNCWFLAALANLAENKHRFRKVVPRHQRFSREYVGMFRFRFWRFGEWIEVVVDDRLPTRNGKLIYLRSTEENEFWSALLEKAYAKLHGSYKALVGGSTLEAAVDFTKGIPEVNDLANVKDREKLFKAMLLGSQRGAFMGCALNSINIIEAEKKGLFGGHAYTITKVVELRPGLRLIRVRNPHGNENEWNGTWSDSDQNSWDDLTSEEKQDKLGLSLKHDGEFYMAYEDFLKYFGEVETCHLDPETTDVDDDKTKFELLTIFGKWKAGKSSGGCGNAGTASFAKNPQFFVELSDPDLTDNDDKSTMVVSLAQKQIKRKDEFAIGFKIYNCTGKGKKLKEDFFKQNSPVATSNSFINHREVSKRFILPAGRYCIIPCTFKEDQDGEFMLRIFVEKHWGSTIEQEPPSA